MNMFCTIERSHFKQSIINDKYNQQCEQSLFYLSRQYIHSQCQNRANINSEMGNTCYNNNQNDISLQHGELQLQPSRTANIIHYGRQNQMEANPETLSNQEKPKISIANRLRQRLNSQANQSNYKMLVEQQYEKTKRSYEQHYIDEAYEHAEELKQLIAALSEKKLFYNLNSQQQLLLSKINKQYQDIIFFQNEIDRSGWQLKSDKNGIKISCRREEDGTVGCRIQALSDVPFEILISIMIEVQFYKQFTPFLQISREQKGVSRNCRIGYTLNHIPFFTRRQSYFQGIGYSRLCHPRKQLFLFTRSIHDKEQLQRQLQYPVSINPDYIQLDYKYFVVRYRPIKKNIGIVDIGINVDAKMSYIPTWLMEKVSLEFGEMFFKNIVRISKNFKGSKWEKNVEKNPHLFLYFQKEVRNFLERENLN